MRAKSNHLQAGSSKSMCTVVSWSRWEFIQGLLGYFGSIWVGDNAWGSNLWSLNFGVHEVKKFKFGNAENMGCWYKNRSISLKVQIFCEGSILMKCGILFNFWFLKIFIWFLGGVKGRVEISDFMKVFKMGWVLLCVIMLKIMIFLFLWTLVFLNFDLEHCFNSVWCSNSESLILTWITGSK